MVHASTVSAVNCHRESLETTHNVGNAEPVEGVKTEQCFREARHIWAPAESHFDLTPLDHVNRPTYCVGIQLAVSVERYDDVIIAVVCIVKSGGQRGVVTTISFVFDHCRTGPSTRLSRSVGRTVGYDDDVPVSGNRCDDLANTSSFVICR